MKAAPDSETLCKTDPTVRIVQHGKKTGESEGREKAVRVISDPYVSCSDDCPEPKRMGNQGEAGGQKENSAESNSPVEKAIEAGWEQGEV